MMTKFIRCRDLIFEIIIITITVVVVIIIVWFVIYYYGGTQVSFVLLWLFSWVVVPYTSLPTLPYLPTKVPYLKLPHVVRAGRVA